MIKGNVLIYTHTDMDGFGSNLIAHYIENNYSNVKFTCKNLNYNQINEQILQDIKDKTIFNYDKIFITDISVNDKVANLLDDLCGNDVCDDSICGLELLDHHESALFLNFHYWCNIKTEINGIKTSGAELFALSIFDGKIPNEIQNMIENIKLYDTWLWSERNDITPKKLNDLFLLLGFNDFEKGLIESNYNVNNFIENNKLLLKIQQNKIDKYIKKKDKTITTKEINGYNVGIVFAERYISELGNSLAKLHPELDIIAMIGDGFVSYRSIGDKDKNNCCEFAKLFGGGGHKNSSGNSILNNLKEEYINNIFKIN